MTVKKICSISFISNEGIDEEVTEIHKSFDCPTPDKPFKNAQDITGALTVKGLVELRDYLNQKIGERIEK